MRRPYAAEHQYSMNVVRHDHEHIQFDGREMLRYGLPALNRYHTASSRSHCSVYYLPKYGDSVKGADRDEIPTGSGVIVSLEPEGVVAAGNRADRRRPLILCLQVYSHPPLITGPSYQSMVHTRLSRSMVPTPSRVSLLGSRTFSRRARVIGRNNSSSGQDLRSPSRVNRSPPSNR